MKIISIATSKRKGTRKHRVDQALLLPNHGISGDAHAGPWHRQVSFLAAESIVKACKQGMEVTWGDFAENIATWGIDWKKVPVGTQLLLGVSALVEITQIGKECHKRCSIFYLAGDCIMPREGIFARMRNGGTIQLGDTISILMKGLP